MRALLALIALFVAAPALAQAPQAAVPTPTIASPDGSLRVILTTDSDGRPHYAVERRGKLILAPSRLGIMLTDAAKLERAMRVEAVSSSSADSTWEQPWGEWKTIRDRHNEMRVRLKEIRGARREMDVVFRVFDDGIGFRYEIPDQPNLKTARIAEELTEFALAENGTAWWIPGGEWNRYEYLYNTTRISEIAQAHTPLTVRFDDGTHLAFHEAALVDYSGMWLRRVEGTKLRAVLAPGSGPAKVVRDTPFVTPWRTMVVADDAAGLYASHIELNLNAPNKLGDVSWFKPSKYVGIWWAMHIGLHGWGGDNRGATTANVKRYIDFAAANGFRGVLVEGWNKGWDSNWWASGTAFDFATPIPEFDMPLLAAYAKKKGVHLIGHHETAGAAGHYDAQLERAYAYAAANGEEVVKTGYVADAGQLERTGANGEPIREWHDGQWAVNHHQRVVEIAARHKVAVNPHEPVKDTGLRRTYPNWVSREGARGMEYNAWGQPRNPPEHEAILVFTRMLSGPMDYTPGVLSLTGQKDEPFFTTIAKQLALYVVLYSPIQMAADLPENYAKYPGPFQFIKDVPTDWEDTRVLAAAIGDYVAIARKERGGQDWYLGAIGDEAARSMTVKLDFLSPGKTYEAQIYRDGDDADYRTEKRHSIVIEKRKVTSADTLTLKIAPGGGQAIRFKAK